jgi:hypothetical protein
MLMVVLTNRKPASDFGDSGFAASKDAGLPRGGSKTKSKDVTGTDSTPKLPNSIGTELPSDVKALSELPDPLASPVIPAKKN